MITENTIHLTQNDFAPLSLTIETWTVVSNMDTETKTNYPYGYSIYTTNDITLELYIHTDKLSMYSGSGQIFIKQ